MRLHPGEPEAVDWQVVPLSDMVRKLMDASPGITGRPRVIAIDGRGGSGKTTLAERLGQVVPNSAIVHTDDIAWNQAYFDWGSILATSVLNPLHRGEAVNFRPTAWAAHGRPGSITVRTDRTSSGSKAPGSSGRSSPPAGTPRCGSRAISMSRSGFWWGGTETPRSSGNT